jgi:RNA polymerase-binding transcription factor DksA
MRELSEIDAALTRIVRGKYGICELTGTPISEARLEAIPTARYGVVSQKKHEKIAQKRNSIRHEDSSWVSGVEEE